MITTILAVAAFLWVAVLTIKFSQCKKKSDKLFNDIRDYQKALRSDIIDETRNRSTWIGELMGKVAPIGNMEQKLTLIQKAFEKLQFEVKTPPKYKVGDKAPDKGWVVTKVDVKDYDPLPTAMDVYYRPNGTSGHGGTIEKTIPIYVLRNFYTSTNIKTGEVKTWAE